MVRQRTDARCTQPVVLKRAKEIDEDHRKVGDGLRQRFQQVVREGVEPLAIFQHDQQRMGARRRRQAVGQQPFTRRLAQPGVQRSSQIVVGNFQLQHHVQQRQAWRQPRIDGSDVFRQFLELASGRPCGVDTEYPAPDRLPDKIAPVDAIRLAFAAIDGKPPLLRRLDQRGRQPRLADARLTADANDLSVSSCCLRQLVQRRVELGPAPDHGQRIDGRRQLQNLAAALARQRKDGDRLALALDADRRQRIEHETAGHRWIGALADQNLAGCGRHHQPRGHVDLVAQHAVGAMVSAAIRAGAHPPLTDPDLHVADEG